MWKGAVKFTFHVSVDQLATIFATLAIACSRHDCYVYRQLAFSQGEKIQNSPLADSAGQDRGHGNSRKANAVGYLDG